MTALEAKQEERRQVYMNDEGHEKYMKDFFYYKERTDHKGIIPAKDRIKQYKTKQIKRGIPSALPPQAPASAF